jgi:hypothetical protein
MAGLLAAASLGSGCEPKQPATAAPRFAANAGRPPWKGALARQFDDTLEPHWLTSGTSAGPSSDLWFGSRTQAADYVLRVQVVSTTTRGVGPAQGYLLTLRVMGAPLAGPQPPTDTIEVEIRRDNPLLTAVRLQDLKLTRRTFIAFFKGFSGPGAADFHWYLAGDDPQVVAAVRDARALSDVGHALPVPKL